MKIPLLEENSFHRNQDWAINQAFACAILFTIHQGWPLPFQTNYADEYPGDDFLECHHPWRCDGCNIKLSSMRCMTAHLLFNLYIGTSKRCYICWLMPSFRVSSQSYPRRHVPQRIRRVYAQIQHFRLESQPVLLRIVPSKNSWVRVINHQHHFCKSSLRVNQTQPLRMCLSPTAECQFEINPMSIRQACCQSTPWPTSSF